MGTIITKVNDEEIHSAKNISKAKKKGIKERKQMERIEFETLTAFALNGNGVPTLQTDQLNVIAHHINAIQMMDNNHVSKNIYQEFWPDKTEWPEMIDSFNVLKLTWRKIFSEESPETIDAFVKLEWKQLNRYNQVGMFGKPCYSPLGAKVLPWVWTYM